MTRLARLQCSCIIFCHLRVVHYCVIPRQFKNCHACSFLTHLAWCSVEKQARKESGSVEQVNYCKHFREHNHVERSLGHKDKQRMSATSQVKKRRRISTSRQCKRCDKVFSRPANLQRHMLTHTGEKLHECSECHKKFSRLGNLQRHMLTHAKEKPYECSRMPQVVFTIMLSTVSHADAYWRETARMP